MAECGCCKQRQKMRMFVYRTNAYIRTAQLEEPDYRKLRHAYSPNRRKPEAESRIMFKRYMCGIYSMRKLQQPL